MIKNFIALRKARQGQGAIFHLLSSKICLRCLKCHFLFKSKAHEASTEGLTDHLKKMLATHLMLQILYKTSLILYDGQFLQLCRLLSFVQKGSDWGRVLFQGNIKDSNLLFAFELEQARLDNPTVLFTQNNKVVKWTVPFQSASEVQQ